MNITHKQLLGFTAFITCIMFYLVSYDYLIIRLGPSATRSKQSVESTTKEPTNSLIPNLVTPEPVTDNIKQTNLNSLDSEGDKQNLLLTPPDQRAPTSYEAALNEATEPVVVMNFPVPVETSGIDRFQNI
tara:strand:+ start:2725 stop:3114 length:390 start_codon:yes stop_codon:yes gene_type:complete